MLAIYVTKPGNPDVVQVRETAPPELADGQALVKVKAAGINYAEIVIRRGLYPDAPRFPFVPGYEFAGVVENTRNACKIKPGDRVLGIKMFGCQAEYVAVEENQLFSIPANMDFLQAAAIPVNYLTAHFAVFRLGNLRDSQKVLIHSCAGGVGTAATQLALTRKAEVFGTTSSEEKADYLKKIGVRHPIVYTREDFSETVRRISPGGVDLVLDPVGGPTFRKSFNLLAGGGRIICYGVADLTAGGRRNIPRLIWKFLTLPRLSVLNLIQNNRGVIGLALNRLLRDADEVGKVMIELIRLYGEGAIRLEIGRVYDFREADKAHQYLESGRSTGKLILNFDK